MATRQQVGTLRRLRREQSDRAFRRLGEDPGDSELAAALGRIEQINALLEGHDRSVRQSRRLGVVFGLGLVGMAIVGAGAYRVSSARAELKAETSAVAMTTPSEQRVVELLAMTDVAVDGAAALDAPAALGLKAGEPHFRLSSEDSVVLEPIDVPAHTQVSLERLGAGRHRLRLRFPKDRGASVAISLAGTVKVPSVSAQLEVRFDSPAQLEMRWPQGSVATFTFSTKDRALTKAMLVDAVSFDRTERIGDYSFSMSSITKGELVFSDYNHAVSLDTNERLHLAGVSGHVLGIVETDSGLQVTYAGAVSEAHFGEGAGRRSQMPSLLDYFTRHKRWATIVASLGAVLTLLFTGWTWWRDAE